MRNQSFAGVGFLSRWRCLYILAFACNLLGFMAADITLVFLSRFMYLRFYSVCYRKLGTEKDCSFSQ